jgi:hypothetical protein
MNDLDDRLRSTLHELAGTVPPTPHARVDLARRLGRQNRRPMLVAAAALVVAATVVISVALNQDGDPAPGSLTTTPLTESTVPPVTTTTKLPNGDLAGPIEVGRFETDGLTYVAMLSVIAMNNGEHWSIEAYGPPGQAWPYSSADIVPTWPAEGAGRFVKTHSVLNEAGIGTGPLPNLMVFFTSPTVTTLEVQSGDGQPVTVRQVAKTPGATFYLADFAGPTDGFGYTAKDAAGNVLESAIT